MFGKNPSKVDYGCIPSAVFSHPPLAGVGLTEGQARTQLGSVKVYTSDFRPMKNVLANRNERALFKLVVDADEVAALHRKERGVRSCRTGQNRGRSVTLPVSFSNYDRSLCPSIRTRASLPLFS